MNDLEKLIKELDAIIAQEVSSPLDLRGSYVLGTILGDYWDLYESNAIVERIFDYANDLEVKNGSNEQLEHAWQEIKRLTQFLKDQQKNNS